MSWQSYVDTNLLGSGLIHAAILGIDGSIWAKSSGIDLKQSECSGIAQGYKNKSFVETGFVVGGKKYMVLKSDDRSVYSKLSTCGAVAVKTKTAILIGIYDDKLTPGVAANVVERLGDYLIDNSC
ncbi:hypothetical protein ACTFIU_005417 [Dictyostelium citrinum]